MNISLAKNRTKRKKVAFCIAVIIFVYLYFFGFVSGAEASAAPLPGTSEMNITEVVPAPGQETDVNAIVGYRYRAVLSEVQYLCISKVEYSVVKMNDLLDEPELDEKNNVLGDRSVQKRTVNKEDFQLYGGNSPLRYAYFDITVNEWCAIVFTVYYNTGAEDEISYDSEVFYSYVVDNSPPSVTYTAEAFGDGYIFRLTMEGNRPHVADSANSNLSAFKISRKKGENGAWETVYERTNINSAVARYDLTIDPQYSYAAEIKDKANNVTFSQFFTYTSVGGDRTFEVAVDNARNYLAEATDFDENLLRELDEYRAEYFLLLHDSETEPTEIEDLIEDCSQLLAEITRLKELKSKHGRDYALTTVNGEFIGGNAEIMNAYESLSAQKYGQRTEIELAAAKFDGGREEEMSFLGINRAKSIYSLSITARREGILTEEFETPMMIKIPLTFKNVRGVLTYTDGEKKFEEIRVDATSEYTIIYLPQSYGTVTLFGETDNFQPLYFLLLLLIIPVGIAIFFIVKFAKKKKSRREQPPETD